MHARLLPTVSPTDRFSPVPLHPKLDKENEGTLCCILPQLSRTLSSGAIQPSKLVSGVEHTTEEPQKAGMTQQAPILSFIRTILRLYRQGSPLLLELLQVLTPVSPVSHTLLSERRRRLRS